MTFFRIWTPVFSEYLTYVRKCVTLIAVICQKLFYTFYLDIYLMHGFTERGFIYAQTKKMQKSLLFTKNNRISSSQ